MTDQTCVICVIGGGPVYRIAIPGGKSYAFEMHHYCGPTPLKADCCDRKLKGREELKFLHAVSLWCQQGKKIGRTIRDIRLCVYEWSPMKEHSSIELPRAK